MSDHSYHPRNLAFMLLGVFLWSVGPLFVKYFTAYYDVFTQNAFRYSSAALMLLAWSLYARRRIWTLDRDQWKRLVIVGCVNVFLQTVFASGYYYIYPSVASLVMRMDIVFVCLLSLLFFHDERQIVKSPLFLTGALLALLGLLMVVFGQDPLVLERLQVSRGQFWVGVGFMIAYAFSLAVYALTIKRAMRRVDPITGFTHVAWITATGLICLNVFFGTPSDLWRQSAGPLMVMVVSALLCIVIAHTAIYAALREIKAVVATTLQLLVPVLTCTWSAMLFHDTLSFLQMVGGLGVIGGAWITLRAQNVRHGKADT